MIGPPPATLPRSTRTGQAMVTRYLGRHVVSYAHRLPAGPELLRGW